MQRKERISSKRKEMTVELDLAAVVSVSLIALMGVLLLFVSLHFVKSFIPVSRFSVTGDSPYEASELAAGADIKKGDKLYRIDVGEAKRELLENCAYIESVKIKRNLFGRVRFVVESFEPIWYVEISGDYYVLDEDLRVLEETKNRERLYDSDLIALTLPRIKTAIVGEYLTFGDGEGEIEETKKIMEIIRSSPAFLMICSADIDNRYDIHFEFDTLINTNKDKSSLYTELDDVFVVNVGGYSKLEAKLEYILRALGKENLDGVVGGTIDVSDEGDKVSIRPIYVKNEEEETEAS